MTALKCTRCGGSLAAALAGSGAHVLCCDPSCDRWPCDGTHRPGQPVTGSLSDVAFYPPKVQEAGGWCVSCGEPIGVAGGACSPICVAQMARKRAPHHYEPREVWS